MKKLFFLLFLISVLLSNAKSNEVYLKIDRFSDVNINEISSIVSIDKLTDNSIFAYASKNETAKLKNKGFNFIELPHPNTLVDVITSENFKNDRIWTAYPTYEAYVSAVYQFAIDYPNLCSVQNIGNSVEGREILFVKISDNVSIEEAEPEFMYSAQMHGDEILTYIVMLNLIEYLLVNYNTDTYVQNLVDNIEIWINPLSNPDGTYAGGNSTVSGATRYNSNSVDLNRNFPDPEDGENPDGNPRQIENTHMMNFAGAHNFVMNANLHNGAEVVNYPWDTWITRHADDDWYQFVSHLYADEAQADSPSGYIEGFDDGITNGYDWYTTSGCRQDYFNYFKNCREVTLELSTTKMLPAAQLSDYWGYNKDALLLYMEQCLYGIRGITTDEYGNPIASTIEVIGHDNNNSQMVSDPDFGDYYRMISPGTYNLRFSADGYDDIIVNSVVVTQNNSTIIDVQFGTIDVEQTLCYNSNWNLFSLYVHPDVMTPESIFSPIINDVIQVKNLDQTFDPDLPSYMNSLSSLEDGGAYWINLENSTELSMSGELVDCESTMINLQAGWNLLGYPLENSQNIETTLSSILNYTLQVKSLTETYDPSLPSYMNSLSTLLPGEAYWINVSEDCSFTYPLAKEKKIDYSGKDDFCWDPIIYPNNSATIYLEIESEVSCNDALIGAFVGDECRGVSHVIAYEDRYFSSLVVSIKEADEMVTFKICSDEVIYSCNEIAELTFGDVLGIYPDQLFSISFQVTESSEEDLNSLSLKNYNFPNPFNPETTIFFQVSYKTDCMLFVYNMKGQKVKDLVNDSLPQGEYAISWDGRDENEKNVSSGVYFYMLQVGEKKVLKKMLLIK